jgi:hypothetical protein
MQEVVAVAPAALANLHQAPALQVTAGQEEPAILPEALYFMPAVVVAVAPPSSIMAGLEALAAAVKAAKTANSNQV